MFHKIDMETWPRKSHYEYYMNLVKTSYQLDAELDVTNLKKYCEREGKKFYPLMIHTIMRGVNSNKEFRMALDNEGNLGYYDICHPQYTIFHEDDCTFSDLWTYYDEDMDTFYESFEKDMAEYGDKKGIKIKPGKPDAFICISALPWLDFKSMSHDTRGPGPFFFPIITYGKYHPAGDRLKLTFSVFVNHAAADGYHTAKLINGIQEFLNEF